MKKLPSIFHHLAAYFFILLFFYASISKILDFENFQVQIGQSPLLSAYAGIISYGVIIVEFVIVGCLCVPTLRILGMYASTALMSAFTVYIYLILNFSDFVPCSCGGILEKLGWTEHLVFNIGCVVLGCAAVLWSASSKMIFIKRAFVLVISSLLSVSVVVILFISSEHIMKKENNFTRRFLPNFLLDPEVISRIDKDSYFAGINGDSLYLGYRSTPLLFSSIHLKTHSSSTFRIYPDLEKHQFKNLRLTVKDHFYYLYDGTVPLIYRGKIGQHKPDRISYQNAYFSQLVALDPTSFALRTQSSETHAFTLAKLDLQQSPMLQLYPKALQKQLDGIFDLDGQLVANWGFSGSAVYAYTYRNQFIVINDHFKNISRQKTIDQHKQAVIETVQLSNGEYKMKAPPVKVNAAVSAFKNYVFIVSESRGKYEPISIHKNRRTIDVYNTLLSEYSGSFYIPERKITDVLATDKGILILSDKNVMLYKFRKPFQ
jgi:hypothetical protein